MSQPTQLAQAPSSFNAHSAALHQSHNAPIKHTILDVTVRVLVIMNIIQLYHIFTLKTTHSYDFVLQII